MTWTAATKQKQRSKKQLKHYGRNDAGKLQRINTFRDCDFDGDLLWGFDTWAEVISFEEERFQDGTGCSCKYYRTVEDRSGDVCLNGQKKRLQAQKIMEEYRGGVCDEEDKPLSLLYFAGSHQKEPKAEIKTEIVSQAAASHTQEPPQA